MNKSPQISIIMPAYGVEKYIANAIESVLAQSFKDWELLVVNDGCKDNSRVIAKEYEAKDDRITVFDKDNGGLSDTRNFGLKYAKGKYIHFFDSDDWIEPDFYASLLSIADNKGCDVLICGYKVDHESEAGTKVEERPCFNGTIEESPLSLLSTISLYFNYAWNKLFLREFLVVNRLLYEKGLYLVEDCEFMSRLINYTSNIYYVTGNGYHYMDRQRQTLSKMFDDKVIGFSERRIDVLYNIFSQYSCSDKEVEVLLEKVKFNNSVTLLNLLFFEKIITNRSQRISYFRQICCSSILNINRPYKVKHGLFDKIILYILHNKYYIFCEIVFKLKSIIRYL